ncbi:MAG TPA: arsenate reductase (glutaredoxin) [Alphaproteobacteria bacterium]|nr:arsenate reductase (glutaredoxin) [Alphaproteobacteria bacterium]
MSLTIYHNPKCGTSRKVLAALRDAGHAPEVIEYLKTPPSRSELKSLFKRMGIRPADGVRKKEKVFAELKLAKADDEALLDAMAKHPILIERPIVVSGHKARLCRPPETVKEFL